MTHIPVSGHKQSIAHEKTVAREKKFTTAFSSYGNVTFLSARYIRERKYSSALLLLLSRIFFALKAIVREYPSSFPIQCSPLVRKKKFQEKVVKIYFDVN